MLREITIHRSGLDTVNDRIVIKAGEPGPGGASQCFELRVPAGECSCAEEGETPKADPDFSCLLQFARIVDGKVQDGVTIESLLAVLVDRLTAFQAGPFACGENGEALSHLLKAVAALQRRTKRRVAQNVEGTLAPHVSDDKAQAIEVMGRVSLFDHFVTIEDKRYVRVNLATQWAPWGSLISHVQHLKSPLTPAELTLLGKVPAESGGSNGYKELRAVCHTAD
jgi:hypothetical protein